MFALVCCNQQQTQEVEEMPLEQSLVPPTLLERHVENDMWKTVQLDVKDESRTPEKELPCPETDMIAKQPSTYPDLHAQDALTLEIIAKRSLNTSLRAGKYIAASRALLRGDEHGSGLDEATLERIHRIDSKFNEATRMLTAKPGDLKVSEHNKQLGLHWGLKLEGSIMQIVSVKDYDVDFVKMIELDLQRDMEDKTCEDNVSQEILGAPFPHDICWRRKAVIKGIGQKLDDVMMVNSVNALDEPLSAVCTMKYTLAESATADPHGTPLPPVAPGSSRTPFVMYATSFTPLALGGDAMRGVRKLECLETKLSPMLAKVLGVMPNFLLKKLVRGNQEAMAKLTTELLKSAESENLLKASHHADCKNADFLEQLRQEIIAKPVKS